ncbi:branched-chain amino acid ABC transporter permease [Sphaerisporangium krabiense]|uniref:Branched-chain amino acid transport system permease protein n=1 Tax=Sphaerisporangium krabiense TaxID=763782 RepID=A0A7W8Z2C5_9ACTN|nr:branched-chain amino acid ABC transporter ATP-binding protein/permease [Sphaerisporangium krabiense]MBB5626149.1 branched-chain amino acid transport system permease protein [Sphaerisporangium krabiense]GII66184.1 branched-chain amino acid ABC transporter permease [Sphaerisporangium krabiense]
MNALLHRYRPLGVVLLLALLLIAPTAGLLNGYWSRTVMLIAILSLLVSGLNVVLGYAGELAMGQVALYAVGAYVAGYLGVELGMTNVLFSLLGATLAAVVVGLITGIPGLRLGGWSLAMVTFFLVTLVPNLVDVFSGFTGGTLGMATAVPTLFGMEIVGDRLYWLIILVVAAWFTVARNLLLSRHGNMFLVLRQSPILASVLGVSVYRLKLLVYVVGAIPAALAGALFSMLDGFIAPDTFTFALALSVLAASVVGGATSVYGAIAGAAVMQLGQQTFTQFQTWQLVIYGAFLLIAGIAFNRGLAGLAQDGLAAVRRRGWLPTPAPATVAAEPAGEVETRLEPLHGVTLRSEGLGKSFGGNRALDDVTIEARPGEVTALIGPNGSGKTTMLNLICGLYKPSAGRLLLGEEEIGGHPTYRIARHGVARTFQTPLIPAHMTTLAFVATGRYVSHRVGILPAILRLPGFRKGYATDDARAMALLRLVGIADVAHQQVDSLALGTRRLVEVARCLASGARVFLFDEVGSGLDESDLEVLERAIGMIREAGGTVILVEHNFPLVLKLSDRIHVLSQGRLLASGTPAQIQNDRRVLAEYTGATDGGDAPDAFDSVADLQAADGPATPKGAK